MHAQYGDIAAFYDFWPEVDEFSAHMVKRTLEAFQRHGVDRRARVCDVACGAGHTALRLSRAGYRVQGIDISHGMLKLARARAREGGERIRFQQGDMRTATITTAVDAVTCFYDSINHLLTQRDVQRALRHMREMLVPGGLLCFDANTEFCFEEFWGGLVHKMEHEGAVQFIEGSYDPRSGRAHAEVTGFLPSGRDRYRKFVEHIDERFYPASVWKNLLRRAGFEQISLEPFDPWDHGGSKRMKWFVTAVKPAG